METTSHNATNVKIEGHRGGMFDFDNTISSFNQAVENGLDSIEFDVWLTSDNVPVILHGGPEGQVEHDISKHSITKDAHINTISFEQIREAKLPNGEQIPTLEEMLDQFHGKIHLNCEVKEKQPEFAQILIDLLKKKDIQDGFLLSSFEIDQLQRIKDVLDKDEEYNPVIRFATCHETFDSLEPEDFPQFSDVINFDSVVLTNEVVESIHKAGKLAGIYFYPSSNENEETYAKAVSAGVDIIISDHPLVLRAYLSSVTSS
ncbi:unnamed protein product [Moneuplotes crassus]|uniref:GP-PDE domain-containing protein n=1 Tax=Euplotes crassus TaxID=5936 RepID=A0AAD1XTB3_EUPCR|nr:unnamed protein product [Moneuplotes crassus]